jgi:hypothetical protein
MPQAAEQNTPDFPPSYPTDEVIHAENAQDALRDLVMSTPERDNWPMGDLEPAIRGLRGTLGIMSHLVVSGDAVSRSEWETVSNSLSEYAKQIEKLWKAAFERHVADKEAHLLALAAAEAEKSAPGSKRDIELAQAMWGLMRRIAQNTVVACDEEGAKYQDDIRNRLAAVSAAEADMSRAAEEGPAT